MVGHRTEHLKASVIITTKNRKDDLRKALSSVLTQTSNPEVIVVDDGSTDGTADLAKQEFPSVRVERSDTSLGLICQRNRAARMASTPILISIDDDAVFSTPTIIESTIREFDHPRVGAVAIPFVDVNRSPAIHQRAPNPKGVYATYSYIGTAHAIRRDVFLGLSGYREILFHQGEEEDYCIRMLNAGWITRCGNSDPIHHFESPRRSLTRMDFYGARNKVLYAWHNVPFPHLPGHLAVTTVKTLLQSLRPDRLWTRLRGVIEAYKLCFLGRTDRLPVARKTYRLSRRLKTQGAVPLDEIESLLAELPSRLTWDCEPGPRRASRDVPLEASVGFSPRTKFDSSAGS
jgi:glycosyltransferase involved in cell wall biosynthesis